MAKFTFYITTNYVGSKREEIIEIDDDELKGKTDEEIDKYIYEHYFIDWMTNNSDSGFFKNDK